MTSWLEDIGFKGTYVTEPVNILLSGDSAITTMSWIETIPSGTSLLLQSSLSQDNGNTWSEWKQCYQNQSIPHIVPEVSLVNAKIKFRVILQTNNQNNIPRLGAINLYFNPVIIFNNIGDVNNKPEIWINKISNGDFSLTNISDNNEVFKFTGLIDNEIVYVNNENEQIETDIPGYYRLDNFNNNYLDIPIGINIFKVSGNAKIQFRTEFKVLA